MNKKNQKNQNKIKVGIVICTLNCKDMLEICLKSIQKQDATELDIKVYCPDSDSTDGTIDIINKYSAVLIGGLPKGYMEGIGGPKSLGVDRAIADGCDYIFTIDSDNELIGTDWLQKMIMPMEKDPTISFCICRMLIDKSDPLINQICSFTGTDQFATFKSLDPLITLGKIPLIDCGDYWTHNMTLDNLRIFGGYYTVYRRKTIEAIGGHYLRDVDNGYVMAEKGICKFGMPKECYIHHRQASSFWGHIKKKYKWGKYYFEKGKENRKFNWTEDKSAFNWQIIRCLLFIPDFLLSIRMLIKYKNKSWLLYAPLSWLTTLTYILASLKIKLT